MNSWNQYPEKTNTRGERFAPGYREYSINILKGKGRNL